MYTLCPDCSRQYRVRAEQLSAAQGLVICGFCGRKFNALEKLHDRPQRPPPVPLPEVNEPAATAPTPIIPAPVLKAGVKSRPQDHFEMSRPAVVVQAPLDVAGALIDEEATRTGTTRRRSGWATGSLALVLLFAFQLAWFNRDALLQSYPQLVPWAESLCGHFSCTLHRQRDLAAIRILNRDVRLHPNYADMLLVNATMANQSDQAQPFPKIQFTLFDTSGQMLGYREFAAEEYLDRSINVARGMIPGQPVHFVLEIAGPTQDAVSFEFRFL